MKVAIAGKGGAGKTTIAGTLARVIAERGQQVVAIDDDSNPNLALTVGVDRNAAATLHGIPRDMLEERTDADGTTRLVLAVPAEDFIDRYGVAAWDGSRLSSRRTQPRRLGLTDCRRTPRCVAARQPIVRRFADDDRRPGKRGSST
jgi:CO dehydrogenase maturation factor